MNISREEAGKSSAFVKIELQAADYKDLVEKELKAHQKKVQLKGFRPGMVPPALVKKMYGKAILAEEVNKILSDKIQQYITDEKIDIIGRPIPAKAEETVADFDNPSNFVFWFELGLAPEFNMDLGKLTAPHYKILIDDEMVNKYEEDLRRRHGNVTHPEKASEEDMLGGEIEQLDEAGEVKVDGIKTKASIAINTIPLKTLQKKFIDKAIAEFVDFPIQKISENLTDLSAMLHVSKEEAENLSGDFRFHIESISHIDMAELNEELYKKVYPADEIKDEAGFRESIKKEASQYYTNDTNRRFTNDVIDMLVEKTDIALPDDFLKRWIILENEAKNLTQEIIDKEYPSYANSIKWQLIEGKLLKENNIDIKPEDLKDFYRTRILSQYFPTQNADEETQKQIDSVIESMMKNQEEVKRIYDALMDEKLTSLFISKVKQEEKEISFDDFAAMLNKK